MACMFVRVPHYVASFWRNRDSKKSIPLGGKVDVSGSTVLWNILRCGIVRNPEEEVVREGFFCERMWRKMLRGQSVVPNEKGRYVKLIPHRDIQLYLNDAEVRLLCGMKAAKYDGYDEFLCVELPQRVYVDDHEHVVDGQWQLKGLRAQKFATELRKEFWDACLDYVDEFMKAGKNNDEKSKNEGLNRFMTRYDIRIGMDNKEWKTLKRNYYRQTEQRKQRVHSYEEFGEV